ncbi:MAG: UDP-N-acetylmuramate dehydrogenase [Nevskiaceae bacterium]|jgi:UDP-N-acetylmuramate dehydrogenase|nr:UDP-N-acetylmuramate dehydrogenase [Nevskiaceae bacterium]
MNAGFIMPPQFADRVRRDEPLSRHTSWHVGGPADWFFTPRDREDLLAFLRALPPETPLLWLGLGSNLLVRDGGVRGVVISTREALTALERRGEREVYAEAGVPCAKFARQCARWNLGPAEFFSGIPGTMGGALSMNAGAFGGETWEQVRQVETVDRRGQVHVRAADQYRVSYRHVQAPANDEWFLAATLHFDGPSSEPATRALLERRKQTQPIGEWSCGSVFTNPPGDHAARLIETAGLKGRRVGGAVVSSKHANFILNEGEATARDIESLVEQVQHAVERAHGLRLKPEFRVVGEAA